MTFDVGEPQGIDSMSPLVGVVVPAFEAWNMQYATLTDKAAEDFSTIPGLAESWKGSKDKKTWTYKLRDGLKWSDGKPLTSEDIAWNVNTARKEEWLNHSAVVANLTATAPDPQTVVIKSSVPDPKLPTMDVYILPEAHLGQAERRRARDVRRATTASAPARSCSTSSRRASSPASRPTRTTGAASPPSTQVVLRKFNNPDAMVAALKTGELDAAWDIPGAAFNAARRTTTTSSRTRATRAASPRSPSTAATASRRGIRRSLDLEVRKAIAHAIDKKTLVDRVLAGLGQPVETIVPSPEPRVGARAHRGRGLRVRPRQGPLDPRGGRLQGHRRRRRARDAGRRAAAELHLHTRARTARPARRSPSS